MLVTESGMVMLVKALQPENADHPMLVTESGITVFSLPAISVLSAVLMIALQLFLLSYTLLQALTAILADSHLENAPISMLVTDLGIVMLVKA